VHDVNGILVRAAGDWQRRGGWSEETMTGKWMTEKWGSNRSLLHIPVSNFPVSLCPVLFAFAED
jgi:hypothetical protein